MVKYAIKCSRCGAPIQWNKTALNVSCEYCGQPVNQIRKENNFKNKFDAFIKNIPLPSKEEIRDKGKFLLSKQKILKEEIRDKVKFLLSKQKILSERQLEFIGTNANRFFSKKRNIAILIAIPLAGWGYMKINYPIKANLSFPETPYKPSKPKETGDFVLYSNTKMKKYMAFIKQWCAKYRSSEELSECIANNNTQLYFDKGSAIREGDWIIMKLGGTINNGNISTKHFYDLAVNCKKGIMAWYNRDQAPAYYRKNFSSETLAKDNREKPVEIALKMGKLWWLEGYAQWDISKGEYIGWSKENLRRAKWQLSKVKDCVYKQKRCEIFGKNKASSKTEIKRKKAALAYKKIERQKLNYDYNNLFKKTCKIKI